MKIGIAMSGGGVKGATHIGIIKALEENGFDIEFVGGTSSGSIVASLYAMGYDTSEMLKIFEYFSKSILETNPRYILSSIRANKSFLPEGTRTGESIEFAVAEASSYKKYKNISELKMPIIIPTVDINDGKEYLFTNSEREDIRYIKNAEISKAVRASCSFPIMFTPFDYLGHYFVDGGVLNNIPAREVKELGAEKVIAVRFPTDEENKKKNMYSILLRTIDMMCNKASLENLKESDYVIDVAMPNVKIFAIDKIRYCYEYGYGITIGKMDKIKQALEKK